MLFGAQIKEFPSQKKSLSEKDEQWRKDCVDASESMIFFQNTGIRQRRLQKKVNYDLYNGILNKADMERICNPFGMNIQDFPSEPKNYPITNPYIQALKGEEIKRRFDWKVAVINEDAISDKEQELQAKTIEYLKSVVEQELAGQQVPDEEIEKRIKYLKYSYQDMRELSATRLLEYYSRYLDIKTLFTKGWEDFLLAGEELYAVDEINNNPIVRKCNPLNTYFLTSPSSNYVEHSDIVLEEDYLPLGSIIDLYYDYLTADEIEMISKKQGPTSTYNDGSTLGYVNKPVTFTDATLQQNYIDTDNITFATIGGAYDAQGNVRRVRAVWKSLKKVGILKFPNGDEDTVSEEYKLSSEEKSQGITIKWIWIGEWWEGTKIAGHIYAKMEPRKIQFRKSDDLSSCGSGYYGTLCNTNSNRVMSIFDIMKPYQYSYNAYAYRLDLANIKSYGRIGELDLAEIPDGWTEDQYIYYATIMGFRVKDSFKEARKGAATGKLVGQVGSNTNVMDMEQKTLISQGLEMLRYIDEQLATITGINRQRQGQISGDDGLGTTQEAKAASANITESYFKMHDNLKIRVMTGLLETAKFCLKNGNKKIQNIVDDMSTAIYTIDGELLNEAEYGILVGDATQDQVILQSLQRSIETAIQTGTVSLKQMMDVYSNQSMSSIRHKLEEAEEQKQQREQQQVQHQQELEKAAHDLEQQRHDEEQRNLELDRQLKQYEIDQNNQTKITIAEIGNYFKAADTDTNQNSIPDPIEIANHQLDIQKHTSEQLSKQIIEANKLKIHNDKLDLEKQKLASDEKLAKLKLDAENTRTKMEHQRSKKDQELKAREITVKKMQARKKPSK